MTERFRRLARHYVDLSGVDVAVATMRARHGRFVAQALEKPGAS